MRLSVSNDGTITTYRDDKSKTHCHKTDGHFASGLPIVRRISGCPILLGQRVVWPPHGESGKAPGHDHLTQACLTCRIPAIAATATPAENDKLTGPQDRRLFTAISGNLPSSREMFHEHCC